MNGSLIIGTMDGANVEIADAIGTENMFIFGARKDEVPKLRANRPKLVVDPRFEEVLDTIRNGMFGWSDFFMPLVNSIEGKAGGDFYLVANDFMDYIQTQDKVDEAYKDQKRWNKMSILSTAGSGFFSSDRTVQDYNDKIWHTEPCPVPLQRP
eukprot:TRINITY_DN52908_c0_g1_i1.p3 TRINITY_DN52908_c0_g1~~TRINITY_DN52908_c0_g1_i1.p3  ORF type:complete len:153 (-),score=25.12 TRINITY_DN52908_c0_g1_i1:223-681(-)